MAIMALGDAISVSQSPDNDHEAIQPHRIVNPTSDPIASTTALSYSNSPPTVSPPKAVCYKSATSTLEHVNLSSEKQWLSSTSNPQQVDVSSIEQRLSNYNLSQSTKKEDLLFACTREEEVVIVERPVVKLPPQAGTVESAMKGFLHSLFTIYPIAETIFRERVNVVANAQVQDAQTQIIKYFEREYKAEFKLRLEEIAREVDLIVRNAREADEQEKVQALSREQKLHAAELQTKHKLLQDGLDTFFTIQNAIRILRSSSYGDDTDVKRLHELINNIDSAVHIGITHLGRRDRLFEETDVNMSNDGPSSLSAPSSNISARPRFSTITATTSGPSSQSAALLPQTDAKNSAKLRKRSVRPQAELKKEDEVLEEGERRGQRRKRSQSPNHRVQRPRRRL